MNTIRIDYKKHKKQVVKRRCNILSEHISGYLFRKMLHMEMYGTAYFDAGEVNDVINDAIREM